MSWKIFIILEEKVREWRQIREFQAGGMGDIGPCLQLATRDLLEVRSIPRYQHFGFNLSGPGRGGGGGLRESGREAI